MPSKSLEQHKLMEAAANTPGGYDGVPQSVGKEFVAADKEFIESEHPRAPNGEFGNGSGGEGEKPTKSTKTVKKEKKSSSESVTGKDAHIAAKSNMDHAQSFAAQSYTSDITYGTNSIPAYQEVGESLRKSNEVPQKYKGLVDSLDKAMNQASTTQSMKVYRGVSDQFVDQLKAGSEFKDNSFTSTTSEIDRALSFGDSRNLMEITVPKGSKAISMDGISMEPQEKEILLNRGGTYKITGITKNKQGHNIFHVEYSE